MGKLWLFINSVKTAISRWWCQSYCHLSTNHDISENLRPTLDMKLSAGPQREIDLETALSLVSTGHLGCLSGPCFLLFLIPDSRNLHRVAHFGIRSQPKWGLGKQLFSHGLPFLSPTLGSCYQQQLQEPPWVSPWRGMVLIPFHAYSFTYSSCACAFDISFLWSCRDCDL